ncbi:MAG: hypothetical protein JKY61_12355 [Planctomycetes bacterium]|nr:hypothetical protein [Planctomycetota bacterium]
MGYDVHSMVGTSEALAPSTGERVSTGIQSGDHEVIAAALSWSGNHGTFEVLIEHADRDPEAGGPSNYSPHPSGAWLISSLSGASTMPVDRSEAKEFVRLRVRSFLGSPSAPIFGAVWMRYGPRQSFNVGETSHSRNGVALIPARTGGVFGITDDGGNPTVSFVSGAIELGEGTGLIRIPVVLSEPVDTQTLIDWTVSGGTATEDVDFERVTLGQIVIPEGQFRGWLELRTLDDPDVESDETVIVTLTGAPEGIDLGGFSSKSITITDDDVVANPSVGFAGIDPTVVEGSDTDLSVVLSAPALKAVQVWWSVDGGTATEDVDFSIAETSPMLIAAGDTAGSLTLSALNDSFIESDESVQITISSADGADLAGVLTRTVTIQSTDAATLPLVNFVGPAPTIAEGTRALLVVELSKIWTSAISVDWEISGGSATEDADFKVTGSSPLLFGAGSTGQGIIIQSLADIPVEANETVVVTITGATGADLGSDLSRTVTITDGSPSADPVVGFGGTNLTIAENGTATLTVTLSETSESAISVDWSLGGTATITEDYTMGSTSPLTIPAGQLSGTITVNAVDDLDVEGNETVVVSLDGATGGDLGGSLSRTVTIVSNDGAGGAEETVVVSYYEPSGMTAGLFATGDEILVAATFAIDPGQLPPTLYHPTTGEKADLVPVAYDKYGQSDLHQLIGRHTVNGSNHIEFTTHPVVPKVDTGPQFLAVDLDDFTVRINTTEGVVFSARLGDAAEVEAWRVGNLVDEREFWIRSTGAGGEKGPGVRFFIDRRADFTIHPSIIIENSLFNPISANLSSVDADATGEVFYESITYDGRPLGHQMFSVDSDLPSQDTANGVMVKPENVLGGSGPEQFLPNGSEYTWHYVLRSSNVSGTKAKAIAQYHGYGQALSGTYGMHNRRGFGASRYFGMDTTDSRIAHGAYGLTGLASTMERERVMLGNLQGERLAGTGNRYPDWVVPRQGMWHPFSVQDTVGVGGNGIDLYSPGAMVPDGYRQSQIRDQHLSMRHYSGMVNAQDGSEVTAEDLMGANGNGLSPWMFTPRTQSLTEAYLHEKPCFLRPKYTTSALFASQTSNNRQAARALAQDTKPWNEPSTLPDVNVIPAAVANMRIPELISTSNRGFMCMDADHRSRRFGCLETLVWGANRGYAKRKLIKEAVQCQLTQNRFALDPAFNNINANQDVSFAPVGNLQVMIDRIAASGLHQSGGVGGGNMNRGNGMLAHMAALGHRISPPGGTYRTNYLPWLDKFAEAVWEICTTYGCSARNDATDWLAQSGQLGQSLQKHPGRDTYLGATDLAGRKNAVPLDLTIANTHPSTTISDAGHHWSLEQTFQPGYLHYGVTDNLIAGAIPGTLAYTRLKVSVKFLQFMWRHSRNPGQRLPCSHVMVSEGAGGVSDIPGAGQAAHASGELQPGAWEFPRFNISGPFNPNWDHRQLLLMAQSMMLHVEEGNATELEETLGWAFEYFDVQTGDLDDVLTEAFDRFSIQTSDSSIPYASEYNVVQNGAMIATLKGLRETGAILNANPSPLVTWEEPSLFNTGVTNAALLSNHASGRVRGDLVENAIFDWTMEVGFDSQGGVSIPMVIRNCRFRLQDGYGGNTVNSMLYNLKAHSEVTIAGGRKVILHDCEFYGAASACILSGALELEGTKLKLDGSGGDLIKVQAHSKGTIISQSYFGRMGDSWLNQAYNTVGSPGYHNLGYAVHADAIQAEDIQSGTQLLVIGNTFDQIGTYHATLAPQPTHTGWPIGGYSACVFVVARTSPIVGTAQSPAVLVEGNWIKGATIPLRIVYKTINGVPLQPAPEHWTIARNVMRGEQQYSMLAHHGGTRTIEGNIYEPTGQNIDQFLEDQTTGVPA